MRWFTKKPQFTQAELDAPPALDIDFDDRQPVQQKRTPAPDSKDINVLMAWARTQPPMYNENYPKWDPRRYNLGAPTGPVWAYIQSHHYTEHEEVHLGVLLMDGKTQAEQELDQLGVVISAADRAKVIDLRAAQIMWINAEAEDLQELEYKKMLNDSDNRRAQMDALREIKASIDRGAVAANAIDFAKRHPVLAAVFGDALLHGVKNIIK